MSFFKIDVVEVPFNVINHEDSLSYEMQPEHFGGQLHSPRFCNNQVFVIDVVEQSSFQIKTEHTNPAVSSMICLVGVDTTLTDVRLAKHEYFMRQANPGIYSNGVSELNCVLEVGRYILISSTQNETPLKSNLTVCVTSNSTNYSDSPQTYEKKKTGASPRPFLLNRVDIADLDAKFTFRTEFQGIWPEYKLPGTRKLFGTAYCEFHTNPGVIMHFKERTTLKLHLTSKTYQAKYEEAERGEISMTFQPPSITVCVLKINHPNDLPPVIDGSGYTQCAWGYWSP